MKVIWLSKASVRSHQVLSYGKKTFGPNTILRFQMRVEKEVKKLAVFPELGKREPLLFGYRQKEYRCLVIKPHFKLIYYVNDEKNTVFISHFWDTRRNPSTQVEEVKE